MRLAGAGSADWHGVAPGGEKAAPAWQHRVNVRPLASAQIFQFSIHAFRTAAAPSEDKPHRGRVE